MSGRRHAGGTASEPSGPEDAYAELSAARSESRLDAAGLERFALSAYLVGREEECEAAWIEAHRRWLDAGDSDRAAGCAFAHALGLFFRGDVAPALGWVARGRRVLGDARPACVEQAWLAMLTALPALFEGEWEVAVPAFAGAERLAATLGDADAAAFARLGSGYALVCQGSVPAGMALLDEVMAAVTAEETSPMVAGIAYCQVIALCHGVFDVERARQWTAALSRWCDTRPGLVAFRGNCLVHRCEIFQLQGAWRTAEEEAERACSLLAGPPAWDALGSAHYQLGEIQRLRGELAPAEASYRRASLAGHDPEPGLSLLRLAEGRVDLATPTLRRALDEAAAPFDRSRLLPAWVEVRLAAGDVGAARAAAEELDAIAARLGAPYLRALASHALGAVLLAEGDPRGALSRLRSAYSAWSSLEAPYEAARARALLGQACLELGDHETAELELRAARAGLEELGAAPALEGLARTAGGRGAAGPLSARESEVLALVAAGKSNKAIARALVISEKTVARHVSNILGKLDASSRGEAAAYAYRHGLVP